METFKEPETNFNNLKNYEDLKTFKNPKEELTFKENSNKKDSENFKENQMEENSVKKDSDNLSNPSLYFKDLCQKEKFRKKFSFIKVEKFQSLINKNIRNILVEIIRLDSLQEYSINNFHDFMLDPNYKISEIIGNFRSKRIKLEPLKIESTLNPKYSSYYYGEWSSSYKMEGFGIKIFSNGNFYMGTFKNNKMDGLGFFVFANKYKNKEKIKERNLTIEESYKIDIFLSKENFDFENNEISSTDLFYLNHFYSKKNKHSKEFEEKNSEENSTKNSEGKNFEQKNKNYDNNDNEFYSYIGEFNKEKFQGYGEIYFNKRHYFQGLFESNKISIGDFFLGKK